MTRLELSDGGIETTLVFHEGVDLPCFATFPLLEREDGRKLLCRWFTSFLDAAAERGVPFVLDTVTWRANPDWGAQLGYEAADLERANRGAVAFARQLAEGRADVTINGVVGPRGDGYVVGERMTAEEAEAYHGWQVGVLADAGVDRVTAMTLSYPEEAIGTVRAATGAGVPVVPSFTVETDGRLPSGDLLGEAIDAVDRQTDGAAAFFMVNCAHPSHVHEGLDGSGALARIGGFRGNASRLSHAQLDAAEELDDGDPHELAGDYRALRERLPSVSLLGGCCGTDHRHVTAIADAWAQH